jgi:hypothetical protein
MTILIEAPIYKQTLFRREVEEERDGNIQIVKERRERGGV